MPFHGVLADTHAIIWYVDSPAELSSAASAALDFAANDPAQRIYISAISLIEMRYLMEKGRIKPTVLPQEGFYSQHGSGSIRGDEPPKTRRRG